MVLGIIIVAMQAIQPVLNISNQVLASDISKTVIIPDGVQTVLKKACYDCHSNSTNYPWYSHVQPIGWLLAKDINHAKDALNFSEFGSYSPRNQSSKLNEIVDVVSDGSMPLPSYKRMHKNARLSSDDKVLITEWAQQSADSLLR
jgi:hypothetical protein